MRSMRAKGLSQIVVAVILFLIAAVITMSFFIFGQTSLDIIQGSNEQSSRRQITILGAEIAIKNVTDKNVSVTNVGKVDLNSTRFLVYINSANHPIVQPANFLLRPSQVIMLVYTAPRVILVGDLIRVTGDFGVVDEVTK